MDCGGGTLYLWLGDNGELGHRREENEHMPRLVEALAGKKVIGAAAGCDQTAVRTEEGELFTFGEQGAVCLMNMDSN